MQLREKKEKEDFKKKMRYQKSNLDRQVTEDLPIKNKLYEEKEVWVNRKILKRMGVTLPDLELSDANY